MISANSCRIVSGMKAGRPQGQKGIPDMIVPGPVRLRMVRRLPLKSVLIASGVISLSIVKSLVNQTLMS
jgi:hypothetical protein